MGFFYHSARNRTHPVRIELVRDYLKVFFSLCFMIVFYKYNSIFISVGLWVFFTTVLEIGRTQWESNSSGIIWKYFFFSLCFMEYLCVHSVILHRFLLKLLWHSRFKIEWESSELFESCSWLQTHGPQTDSNWRRHKVRNAKDEHLVSWNCLWFNTGFFF